MPPVAVTALDDGRVVVLSRARQFGEEVFMVEGRGELRVGLNFARGGVFEGYETRALQGFGTGQLLWLGRTLSPQIMRPYRLAGAFMAVLTADLLPGAEAVLVRPDAP